jgi:hypothetical protein
MKIKKHLYLSLFIPLFLISTNSFSQFHINYPITKGWEVGFNIGTSYFYGDVNDNKGRFWNNTPFSSFYYDQKRLMGDFVLSKNITPLIATRGHIKYGKLSGSNENLNMYFEGELFSMEGELTLNFIDLFMHRKDNPKFRYYAIAGLGLTSYNAVRKEIGTNNLLSEVGYTNNGKSKTDLTTESMGKFGLGIGYNIDKYWLVNFETTLNYVNTDKLDAFKSTNTELEGFGYMSFGVAYKFNFFIKTKNKEYKSSSGTNNKPHNSGVNNNKKKRLKNKWK